MLRRQRRCLERPAQRWLRAGAHNYPQTHTAGRGAPSGGGVFVVVVIHFAIRFLAISTRECAAEVALVEVLHLSSSCRVAAVDAVGRQNRGPVLDFELIEDVGGAGLVLIHHFCAGKQQQAECITCRHG